MFKCWLLPGSKYEPSGPQLPAGTEPFAKKGFNRQAQSKVMRKG